MNSSDPSRSGLRALLSASSLHSVPLVLALACLPAACGGDAPDASGSDPASSAAAEDATAEAKDAAAASADGGGTDTMPDSDKAGMTDAELVAAQKDKDAASPDADAAAANKPETAADYPDLKIETLEEGEGDPIEVGQKGNFVYEGLLLDGTRFDNGSFPLEVGPGGAVIKGWQLGLVGMKVGERRRLVIPPELGYAERGSGKIPPHATIVFYVRLESLVDSD